MTLPEISVLIPVYNVEKYIERCLRSLFEQSIADKAEFILVNDCTPDSSIEIAKRVIADYPVLKERVHIIEHTINKGIAAARNTGFSHALGNYFIYVDSDDWCEPDYLEQLYKEAVRTGADIVGCALWKEQADNTSVAIIPPFPADHRQCMAMLLSGILQGWLPIKLFRSELFKRNVISFVEGLDVCEDTLISLKAFYFAKKLSYIPKPLYHYDCCNAVSLTASLSEKKIRQIFAVYAEITHFLQSHNICDQFIDELDFLRISQINWILISGEKLETKYFDLFRDKKYYKNKFAGVYLKLYLFCCYIGFYAVPYLLVQYKRSKRVKRY